MDKRQSLIWMAVLIVLALLGLLIAGLISEKSAQAPAPVVSSGTPQVGGPFTLTDEKGATVSDADFRGKYMLIYFGFTFCPDVCPTELQVMTGAVDALGADADKVQPLFITVDPARDTADVMATYVPQFSPRLKGLTGSDAQIAAVAKEFHVFYEKAPDDSSSADYSMDHSSIVYLMGPDGKFLTFFPPGTTPDAMAAKIKGFMG